MTYALYIPDLLTIGNPLAICCVFATRAEAEESGDLICDDYEIREE